MKKPLKYRVTKYFPITLQIEAETTSQHYFAGQCGGNWVVLIVELLY
jgi:hypothetical protein